jgi:hypothetical protein
VIRGAKRSQCSHRMRGRLAPLDRLLEHMPQGPVSRLVVYHRSSMLSHQNPAELAKLLII